MVGWLIVVAGRVSLPLCIEGRGVQVGCPGRSSLTQEEKFFEKL